MEKDTEEFTTLWGRVFAPLWRGYRDMVMLAADPVFALYYGFPGEPKHSIGSAFL
jgi:hypothetical protein